MDKSRADLKFDLLQLDEDEAQGRLDDMEEKLRQKEKDKVLNDAKTLAAGGEKQKMGAIGGKYTRQGD